MEPIYPEKFSRSGKGIRVVWQSTSLERYEICTTSAIKSVAAIKTVPDFCNFNFCRLFIDGPVCKISTSKFPRKFQYFYGARNASVMRSIARTFKIRAKTRADLSSLRDSTSSAFANTHLVITIERAIYTVVLPNIVNTRRRYSSCTRLTFSSLPRRVTSSPEY